MKKSMSYLILFFIFYLIFSVISSLFLVNFGDTGLFKKVILIFIDFPVKYINGMSNSKFLFRYFINALFWTVVFYIAIIGVKKLL